MKKTSAVYVGVDNSEEIEITFTRKTRKEIRSLAKVARVSEAELLVTYLGNINLAGLAGTAHGLRDKPLARRKAK